MNTTKAKDVAAYINAATDKAQPMLRQLQALIKETIPQAEEVISWNQPFYKYHGYLAGFAAYKHHIRFGVVGSALESEDREQLEKEGYQPLERAVQIKYDQKVPVVILRRILVAKAQANEMISK